MSKFGNNGLQRLKARTKGPAKDHNEMGVGATDSRIADVKNSAKTEKQTKPEGEIRSQADYLASQGITEKDLRLGGSLPVGGAGAKGFVKGLVKLGAKAIKKYRESK